MKQHDLNEIKNGTGTPLFSWKRFSLLFLLALALLFLVSSLIAGPSKTELLFIVLLWTLPLFLH